VSQLGVGVGLGVDRTYVGLFVGKEQVGLVVGCLVGAFVDGITP
jgi:hypothetical protein